MAGKLKACEGGIRTRENQSEDTEWNDILRSKGILPPKEKEIKEEDIVNMLETTIESKQVSGDKQMQEMTLDELDELEDEEDERVLLEYRQRRINEMKAAAERARYGEVNDIRAEDYVEQVNKAGEGVWVVLHLYKQGIPQCALINQHLSVLARKFPATKFLRSISTTCIANYPDKNLPTVFVYVDGDMKKQFIGPHELRGTSLTCQELEWMLGQVGAVPTKLEEDPRPKVKDVLFSRLNAGKNDLCDDNDWHL